MTAKGVGRSRDRSILIFVGISAQSKVLRTVLDTLPGFIVWYHVFHKL